MVQNAQNILVCHNLVLKASAELKGFSLQPQSRDGRSRRGICISLHRSANRCVLAVHLQGSLLPLLLILYSLLLHRLLNKVRCKGYPSEWAAAMCRRHCANVD